MSHAAVVEIGGERCVHEHVLAAAAAAAAAAIYHPPCTVPFCRPNGTV